MINWNPFKSKPNPIPMNSTGVQFYGPGSNNVQVIDLSGNGNGTYNTNGVQIIYGNAPQPINQKIKTEVPMYNQGNNYGFVQAQQSYQNTSYQIPVYHEYQGKYNGPTAYQVNPTPNYSGQQKGSQLYPDLDQPNPYAKYPTEQAKTASNINQHAKESAKNSQNSQNPYY